MPFQKLSISNVLTTPKPKEVKTQKKVKFKEIPYDFDSLRKKAVKITKRGVVENAILKAESVRNTSIKHLPNKAMKLLIL